MKKILSLLFIICLLVSCSSNNKNSETKLPEVKTETGIPITIEHFVYKEHTYLYFCNKYNDRQSTIIHDPDCEYCFISLD